MQVPREVLRGGSTSGAPSALPLFLSPRGGWGYPVSLRGGSTSGAPPSALPLFLSRGVGGGTQFPCEGAAPPVHHPLHSPFFSPRGGWGYPVSLRGGSTSGAPPSALPLFLSEGWVGVPSFPARGQHLRCSPSALPPWVGLPGPHPGFLSFHDERNRKACRGYRPSTREGGTLSPLRRRRKASRTPQWGFQTQQKTDLPTHSKRTNRSFVLPQFLRGNTFGC